PPPALGAGPAIALDPAPIDVVETVARVPSTPCTSGELSFGSACLRVDDDRLLLTVHAGNGVAVLGSWTSGDDASALPWVAVVSDGHPRVLRGLAPSRDVRLRAQLRRPGIVDDPIALTVTTLAPRAHVVVNELLARPASKLATQRFVELANDGASPASLAGVALVDGEQTYQLGAATLAPGELALVVPLGFVNGAKSDVAAPSSTRLIVVPSLDLSAGVSIVGPDAVVWSHLPVLVQPASHHASDGRCAPWWPDDAPLGFGLDRGGGATPGAPNAVAGCQ
ncbi:MAG: hypothetical protein ACHREM_18000, partial [Polyangiales bacterium]